MLQHDVREPDRGADLVIQLKQKDLTAFSYIYDCYGSALYGVIHRIIGMEEISEEVLQDTFLRIWDKIDSFDPQKGSLFTWMLRIARNLAIDQLRSRHYQYHLKKKTIDAEVSGKYLNLKDSAAEIYIPDHALNKLLEQLNEKQQMMIRLVYYQGYTHKQISNDYNIPLGSVKTYLRSALIKLRHICNII